MQLSDTEKSVMRSISWKYAQSQSPENARMVIRSRIILLLLAILLVGGDSNAGSLPLNLTERNTKALSHSLSYASRNKTVTADAPGGGNGSDQAPWTLTEAMAQAQAGDIVGIKAGIYVGVAPNVPFDEYKRFTPAFRPSNSGTASNPITFVAEYLAALNPVASERSEVRSGATSETNGWPAFGVLARDYVQFIGLYSDENASNNKGYSDSATTVVASSNGSSVRYSRLIGGSGYTADNHSGLRIEYSDNSLFSDNIISGYSGGTNQSGVIIYKSNTVTIEHNEIFDCGHGIQPKGSDGSQTIFALVARKNIIHDCLDAFRFHGPVKGPGGELSLFYQNVIYDVGRFIEFTSSGSHFGEGDGMMIFNNTAFSSPTADPATISIYSGYQDEGVVPRDNEFFNNIIVGAKSYLGLYSSTNSNAPFIADFANFNRNCLYDIDQMFNGSSSGSLDSLTFSEWQSVQSEDVNSIVSDPLFKDTSQKDFRLENASLCLDLGRDKLNMFGNGVNTIIPAGAYLSDTEIIGVRRAPSAPVNPSVPVNLRIR